MSNLQNDIILEGIEEKYGNLSEILTDEEGYYIVYQSDSGNPSDEGYSVTEKKVYLEDKDVELLKLLKVI